MTIGKKNLNNWRKNKNTIVTTPLWTKCEDETHAPKSGNSESSGTPKNLELDRRGQNNLHRGDFYTIGRSWSVDVQNGLAWAIWTSATQVMGKRRADNQIGSLTPNH